MLRESNFFALAGSFTVEVELIVTESEWQQLIDLVEQEKSRVFDAYSPAKFGVSNPDGNDQEAGE